MRESPIQLSKKQMSELLRVMSHQGSLMHVGSKRQAHLVRSHNSYCSIDYQNSWVKERWQNTGASQLQLSFSSLEGHPDACSLVIFRLDYNSFWQVCLRALCNLYEWNSTFSLITLNTDAHLQTDLYPFTTKHLWYDAPHSWTSRLWRIPLSLRVQMVASRPSLFWYVVGGMNFTYISEQLCYWLSSNNI